MEKTLKSDITIKIRRGTHQRLKLKLADMIAQTGDPNISMAELIDRLAELYPPKYLLRVFGANPQSRLFDSKPNAIAFGKKIHRTTNTTTLVLDRDTEVHSDDAGTNLFRVELFNPPRIGRQSGCQITIG